MSLTSLNPTAPILAHKTEVIRDPISGGLAFVAIVIMGVIATSAFTATVQMVKMTGGSTKTTSPRLTHTAPSLSPVAS